MSRDLPAELQTEIEKPVSKPFLALHIAIPDVVRVFTGTGIITFEDSDGNPQEWLGAEGLGQIDAIGEATDGSATGIKASLLNIPAEFRDDIADQAERGALFEVYLGALNETFQQVISAQLIWKGRLDQYNITDGGDTITVEVTGESRGLDQRRPAIKRFSDEYQQRMHSGDLFFQYVPQMTEVPVLWAKAEPKTAAVTGSSVGGGGNGGNGGGSLARLNFQ